MGGHEILEHTADIGVRAVGKTIEECFEQAARGLISIIGIERDDAGERVAIELSSGDLGALLVDWLNEIVYLHESRDALVCGVDVAEVTGTDLRGSVALAPRGDVAVEGLQVKAVTYHQLKVERTSSGYVAEVYFDI
jgi:SHS2 domain-containing protein